MRQLVKSKKFERLFFLGEGARFWAENTIDTNGISVSNYLINTFKYKDCNILLLHPENEIEIPSEFEGLILGWDKNIGKSFAN